MNHKYLLALLFLSISHLAIAQFAKIIDKDGYVNVRKQASVNSPIVSKIGADEIVYAFSDEKLGDWVSVDYTNSQNKSITGYVHKSRIKLIESYNQIPNITFDENSATFKSKDVTVEIRSNKFDYNKNKQHFSSTQYEDYSVINKFKGQKLWGTDGGFPTSHYTSIKATIKGAVPRFQRGKLRIYLMSTMSLRHVIMMN
ncbi:SH3 domain-containing protein [Sphingobacterium sp. E70]|uniref:SH3 domain-containing protein n=1 Tax=Sphingobacterium sp. E70 TaxID=2853439 RepID=UPI00211CCEE7|nr:SH3 domain-containing protein [Sphingobacterium sp. E70]ULT24964.1 SH3 domain-containing protein [Sphingobacterium sp. E70]